MSTIIATSAPGNLRSSVAAPMLLLAVQSTPSPSAIREKAAEVVARDYYELGDQSLVGGEPMWARFLRWFIRPFEWLFESMEGWPDWFRWVVVVVCVILLVALVSHIVYTFVRAIRGPIAHRHRRYDPAHVEIDPATLERDADRAVGIGDYIGAVRLLFRAALRRIEVAEKKKLRPGFTNRELLRRYRATGISTALERFVEIIDTKWYGSGICLPEDYLACRTAHIQIRDYAQQTRAADDA